MTPRSGSWTFDDHTTSTWSSSKERDAASAEESLSTGEPPHDESVIWDDPNETTRRLSPQDLARTLDSATDLHMDWDEDDSTTHNYSPLHLAPAAVSGNARAQSSARNARTSGPAPSEDELGIIQASPLRAADFEVAAHAYTDVTRPNAAAKPVRRANRTQPSEAQRAVAELAAQHLAQQAAKPRRILQPRDQGGVETRSRGGASPAGVARAPQPSAAARKVTVQRAQAGNTQSKRTIARPTESKPTARSARPAPPQPRSGTSGSSHTRLAAQAARAEAEAAENRRRIEPRSGPVLRRSQQQPPDAAFEPRTLRQTHAIQTSMPEEHRQAPRTLGPRPTRPLQPIEPAPTPAPQQRTLGPRPTRALQPIEPDPTPAPRQRTLGPRPNRTLQPIEPAPAPARRTLGPRPTRTLQPIEPAPYDTAPSVAAANAISASSGRSRLTSLQPGESQRSQRTAAGRARPPRATDAEPASEIRGARQPRTQSRGPHPVTGRRDTHTRPVPAHRRQATQAGPTQPVQQTVPQDPTRNLRRTRLGGFAPPPPPREDAVAQYERQQAQQAQYAQQRAQYEQAQYALQQAEYERAQYEQQQALYAQQQAEYERAQYEQQQALYAQQQAEYERAQYEQQQALYAQQQAEYERAQYEQQQAQYAQAQLEQQEAEYAQAQYELAQAQYAQAQYEQQQAQYAQGQSAEPWTQPMPVTRLQPLAADLMPNAPVAYELPALRPTRNIPELDALDGFPTRATAPDWKRLALWSVIPGAALFGAVLAARVMIAEPDALRAAGAAAPQTIATPTAPAEPVAPREVAPVTPPPIAAAPARSRRSDDDSSSSVTRERRSSSRSRASEDSEPVSAPVSRRVAPAPEPKPEPVAKREPKPEPAPVREAAEESSSSSSSKGIGVLRINSRPWAQVFIDGKNVGNTPLMGHRLPAGKHDVSLVNPQMNMSKKFKVQITADEITTRVEMLSE